MGTVPERPRSPQLVDTQGPECAQCHSKAFVVDIACGGEIDGTEKAEPCFFRYQVAVQEDPDCPGTWEFAADQQCPQCGYEDNDIDPEFVRCVRCDAPAPGYNKREAEWGVCAPDCG